MHKKEIRTDIMNLTLSQWKIIKTVEKDGLIKMTPEELIDLIGSSGGMFFSSKANKVESEFIDSFYKLGNQ